MRTFWEWLRLQNLFAETYFTFDPRQYDDLFDAELEKLIARVRDPARLQALEQMRGFKWLGYIATAVRSSGFREYRTWRETIHEVVVKLLTGKLFSGYDEQRHGPMHFRFRNSVWNAIRNMAAKEQTRRRHAAVPFERGDDVPAPPPAQDEQIVDDFRQLVRRQLGGLGVAVLDARLAGETSQSLVGCKAVGSPNSNTIARVVQEIKRLAREHAIAVGNSELLRGIETAMAAEDARLAKRKTTIAARRAVGA